MRTILSIPMPTHNPLLVVVALIAFMMTGASVVRGADVLVVVSTDSKPYAQAADRSIDSLRADGRSVERLMLSELNQEKLRAQTDPVIAIGGSAAAQLAQLLPAETELYYCMTPRPDRIGLTKRANTSGVSTDPDFKSQIEILERSGIRIKRVGMLYKGSSDSSKSLRDQLEAHVPEKWNVSAIDLDDAGSGAKSIDMLFDQGIDVVWTAADPSVYDASLVKALLLRSIRDRVPMFGFSHALVRAGAPFGVGFEPGLQGERVASMLLGQELGLHEPSDTVLAINNTATGRIKLKLSRDLDRLAEVRFGSE
jgi:putative ABC transport system substrate-binding protein